jgi:hypothetical protein
MEALLLLMSSCGMAVVMAVVAYLLWRNKAGGGGLFGGLPFKGPVGGPDVKISPGSTLRKGGPFNIIAVDDNENIEVVDGGYRINYETAPIVGSLSGGQFWAVPTGLPNTAATLSYEVFIPSSFEWSPSVIPEPGGKLPGFCVGIEPRDCASAGGYKEKAGSLRLMWRENGLVIGYWYPALKGADRSGAFLKDQSPSVQAAASTTGSAGIKLWHASNSGLQLKKNAWNSISVGVDLGTPGQKNGVISITVNGVNRKLTDVKWREVPEVRINTVAFTSFAGGGSETWAFKKPTYTQYRNIKFTPGKAL